MFQAILLEDDERTNLYLREQLTEAFRMRNETLCIASYKEGNGVLQMLSEHYHYDVIFLDIEMPGIDGITLAKEVHKERPEVLLVFISNHESQVFQAFEAAPFRFIRKQDFKPCLPQLVSDIIHKLTQEKRKHFYLTEPCTGDIYSFDIVSLLYIEAQRKDCRLVSAGGEVLLRCALSNLEAQTRDFGFLKCHRSYLVNWRGIFMIGKNTIKLTNGEEIPLSRGLSEQVRLSFMRAVSSEV